MDSDTEECQETACCSVLSLLTQISRSVGDKEPEKRRFNPRPPGAIQEGSATAAVLAFLIDSPGLKTEAQIVWATKRTHSAVSWALLRLRSWNKIDAVEDPSRNSRYFRYRIRKEKK